MCIRDRAERALEQMERTNDKNMKPTKKFKFNERTEIWK